MGNVLLTKYSNGSCLKKDLLLEYNFNQASGIGDNINNNPYLYPFGNYTMDLVKRFGLYLGILLEYYISYIDKLTPYIRFYPNESTNTATHTINLKTGSEGYEYQPIIPSNATIGYGYMNNNVNIRLNLLASFASGGTIGDGYIRLYGIGKIPLE